jgi:hypothetical protein
MKRIHPNLICGATCMLAAAMFASGCQSTSSGVNNAFLAPDRVAPPSTRVLAPGQAQPYYQGDPLPTMQSATRATATAPTAADTAAARSASGRTLAWNAPAAGSTTSNPPVAVTPPSGVTAQTSLPVTRASEAPVSVPADSDTLRFALPSPTATSAASNIAASPASGMYTPPSAVQANNQNVALASYNAPASNSLTPAGTPALSPTRQPASSWQSPQPANSPATVPGYPQATSLANPAMPQPYASPMYAAAQAPPVMPTNPMAVQLRAVPSPPPQPGDPVPRIRMPGYEVPETAANDGFHARTSMQ